MWKIFKLDKNLANQIAAWEVVERPVSVVKELVENSIDAGAQNILVKIKDWWIEQIIISDDWEWIQKDDLELVVEKYTTSKIKSLDDLYNVMTFGFRWEALASISSVSKMELISRTINNNFWNILKINGWDIINKSQIASEVWTQIKIKNLFFNTPARLNYLKKARTEHNHILEFLNKISLSYPGIGIEFFSNDKNVFKYTQNEDLKTRIYNVYGSEFSDNLLYIDFELSGLKITGYISDPKVNFANKNRQVLFVNKRIIKSPLIYKAINDAYNRFIPHSSFPAYVLNLEVDPTQVDVNVHPRKQEVRFAWESTIFRTFFHAIKDKLEKVTLVNSNDLKQSMLNEHLLNENSSNELSLNKNSQNDNIINNEKSLNHNNINQNLLNNNSVTQGLMDVLYSSNNSNLSNDSDSFNKINTWNKKSTFSNSTTPKFHNSSWTKFKSYSPYSIKPENPSQVKIWDSINFSKNILNTSFDVKSNDLHDTNLWKIIGQSHNSYIIVETPDWIKFLDQHALAERVIYEKLVNSWIKIQTQTLLIWESFDLRPKELSIMQENENIFKNMWFDFEIISWNTLILNAVPDFIIKQNIQKIFYQILEDIWKSNFTKSTTLEEIQNKIYAYTSCRSAIKFWNKLNLFEMNKLLNDSVLNYSSTCPHGRPVVFEISLNELKNKYER